ncbi:hypothetical protein PIB30_084966 [Stylosanthes scabra]|uniref:Uncharacterized protein n=1 Tax=Stylosanthes scabra TaxID=79078 RepID=A0ABU6QSP7_9FABA|nr:hypothetical protein [Stylosanthes scabra]
MEVALDPLNYSLEDSSSDPSSSELSPSSESDAACCCCSDTSGEEICYNWEISKSGWSMSISCSCLRMIRSLRRRDLMRSSLDYCEELISSPGYVGTSLAVAHLVMKMGNSRSCFLVLTGSSFMVATMTPGRETDIPVIRT